MRATGSVHVARARAVVAIGALALAAVLASRPSTCAAQVTTEESSSEDLAPPASPIARGRSLGWGVDAIVPLYLGDVRQRDGVPVRYLNPGGGVEARIFYELAGGLGLGASGGIMVHASESTRPVTSYRGALEVRWVIDVGSLELAPLVALSVGILVAQVGEADGVTGYARVLGGVQWILAPWVALEGGVALEGAIGVDAFAEPIAWLSPRIGVTFHE